MMHNHIFELLESRNKWNDKGLIRLKVRLSHNLKPIICNGSFLGMSQCKNIENYFPCVFVCVCVVCVCVRVCVLSLCNCFFFLVYNVNVCLITDTRYKKLYFSRLHNNDNICYMSYFRINFSIKITVKSSCKRERYIILNIIIMTSLLFSG